MLNIGNYNTLKIIKILSFGAYLDGGDGKEILLPTRYVPDGAKVGDEVKVFIYHDNEGRLIATTLRPKAVVGEFAFMRVKSVNTTGAFLDWGLMKDLLVPYKEQKLTMREGKWYLVYVRLDHVTGRIMAWRWTFLWRMIRKSAIRSLSITCIGEWFIIIRFSSVWKKASI